MLSRSSSRLTSVVLRRAGSPRKLPAFPVRAHHGLTRLHHHAPGACRFSSVPRSQGGIMPESENPAPRDAQPQEQVTEPTELSIEEYHERSDAFFEELQEKLEALQESRTDIELEYSQGVLTLETPKGTYVLNKQPPSKQIWLSSPVSGPKRFDWVVTGEGMDQKEGAGQGDWIYLRDGTSLTQLLRKEVGVDAGVDASAPQ